MPEPSPPPEIALLVPDTEVPAGLAKAFSLHGYGLRSFTDAAELAQASRGQSLPLLLVDARLLASVRATLDALAGAGVGEGMAIVAVGKAGEPGLRLQAMLQGADAFVERLDDLALVSQALALLERPRESAYRVLILDRDPEDRLFQRLTLEQAGMQVRECPEPEAMRGLIDAFQPDLLLLDVHAPEMSGLSLSLQLRQQSELAVLPIVFLATEASEEIRFHAIQAGGDDLLEKPLRPRQLVAAVRSRIRRARLVRGQLPGGIGAAMRVGLLRRGDFLAQLSAVLRRGVQPWQLLLAVRVDQAAALTEKLGLAAACELEQGIAQRLIEVLRPEDTYTLWLEYGFGILVRRDSREQIIELARDLCAAVAKAPFAVQGVEHALTLSVGLALPPSGADNASADRWFASAYAAQAIAHRLGGNRHEGVLEQEAGALPAERVLIIREWVKEAAQGQNIVIEFQPMLPLHGDPGGVYALDAKLRDYRAPLAGVPRREYLSIAREAGALPMIERMSLFSAFEAIEEQRTRSQSSRILVPMDLASINDAQMAWLELELRRRKASLDCLVIEFDAAPLFERPELVRIPQRLKEAGVAISLADGSGGLGRVEACGKLPADFLRLPFAALRDVPANSFVELLKPWHGAGRQSIIDRVDNADAVAQLWSMGVGYLQGDALAASGPRLDYNFAEFGT